LWHASGVLAVALAAAAVAAKPDPRQFLRVDARHKVVAVSLVAEYDGANNGFNFDGYGRGELLLRVPVGWRVVVDCENRGGGRHSCAVVKGSLAARPAFAGASSPRPLSGLSPGSRATFSFVASRVGNYRIASLVAGQEQARMYAVLQVTRAGRPSIAARPGP